MPDARYVDERRLPAERCEALLRYLLRRGADELSVTVMALQDTQAPFADAFEDAMAPFERPVALRRGPASRPREAPARVVRLWSFDEDSLARLLSFLDDGIFHSPAGPDGWLEDLAVYRAGVLMLGIVSHEREGVLYLDPREHDDVAELGIRSSASSASIEY